MLDGYSPSPGSPPINASSFEPLGLLEREYILVKSMHVGFRKSSVQQAKIITERSRDEIEVSDQRRNALCWRGPDINGVVMLWNINKRESPRTLRGRSKRVGEVAFYSGGSMVG